jgi:hypothetical protein
MICIILNIFHCNYLRMDGTFKGFRNSSNYNPIKILFDIDHPN